MACDVAEPDLHGSEAEDRRNDGEAEGGAWRSGSLRRARRQVLASPAATFEITSVCEFRASVFGRCPYRDAASREAQRRSRPQAGVNPPRETLPPI